MRAVAHQTILAFAAPAEICGALRLRSIFMWKFAGRMAAIAKGFALALAATAYPIGFSGFNFNSEWRILTH
jgi:hypothetical protein